ncbi:GNAT family N-acetyltransferase [Pontibacter indicus]|uniref:Protein N-acetyltransferase, RimJ/RimL family n=1 Tax=Pontibacter indicus TaxID=1317125 RepID=A0A1R3X0R7_9BACT|nr:GNAT family protein [Pontibacter indicus]SIT84142.1 Protein N-acetyltransferase, RimJ/RimL family [Pontibacter indicus]
MSDFKLRPWTLADLDSLVKHADNFNIARNMADVFPHPYTYEKGRAFLEMVTQGRPPNILAIEVEGEAVGGIGIHPQQDIYRKNAEIGYWLGQPFWGKGIMTEAIRQMVDYGFANRDITRIYARPFGYNIGSQRALEKAGFVLETKLEKTFYKNGEYQDELIYAVRRPA